MRRVRCLGRCGWLLFAEGGMAGELRLASEGCHAEATMGVLPGREGHGAVMTTVSVCSQPQVHRYPAVGGPQSRAVVLRLPCLGLLASSKENGLRTPFL